MGDQLYLERFVWFDNEARRERFPNASKLREHFEIAPKTAQRSIDHFRDRLQPPLEYDQPHKGYYYTAPTFQLPVIRISEEELLALLISHKLITEASACEKLAGNYQRIKAPHLTRYNARRIEFVGCGALTSYAIIDGQLSAAHGLRFAPASAKGNH